jgi:16S rRNA processing protein RimM
VFITLARITRTQGRKGEVGAVLSTSFPERFADRRELSLLFPNGQRREFHLEDFWPHKGSLIFKFSSIDSINDAEALLGCEVQVPCSARAALAPHEAYVSDLVGCRVFAGVPTQEIGTIADLDFSAGEAPLLVVRNGPREFLIPFAAEFIRHFDVAAKRLELTLPAGMLELDAPLKAPGERRPATKRRKK